jgi:long-chain acyl-CoA synthetase
VIGQTLLRVAAERGDAPALFFEERSWSYCHLAETALRWAAVLARAVDTGGGRPVAVQLPNTPDYAAAVVALMVLGIPVLPVNPQWWPGEAANSLGNLRLAGVLASEGDLPRWREVPAFASVTLIGIKELRQRAEQVIPISAEALGDSADGDSPALYLMTSGTTGTPKTVVRSRANLLANARHVGQTLKWAAAHRILPVTPFHHANGFSNGLLLPLLRGSCIVILERFFPVTLARLIRDACVDALIASPVVYRALLSCDEGAQALQLLRQSLSSGAPLPGEVVEMAVRLAGVQIRELYGSSEAGTVAIEPDRGAGGPRSAGRPLSGVEVAILSDDGQALPPGEEGHVAVRSPAVMQGYWGTGGIDPARTIDGWYLIGDRGLLDAGGELQLRGRLRDFINVGGSKVDPGEIESELRNLEGVARCRVWGRRDDRGGEEVCAAVVLRPGSCLDRAAVLAHLRRRLAEYKLPRRIEFAEHQSSALPDKHGDPSETSQR